MRLKQDSEAKESMKDLSGISMAGVGEDAKVGGKAKEVTTPAAFPAHGEGFCRLPGALGEESDEPLGFMKSLQALPPMFLLWFRVLASLYLLTPGSCP